MTLNMNYFVGLALRGAGGELRRTVHSTIARLPACFALLEVALPPNATPPHALQPGPCHLLTTVVMPKWEEGATLPFLLHTAFAARTPRTRLACALPRSCLAFPAHLAPALTGGTRTPAAHSCRHPSRLPAAPHGTVATAADACRRATTVPYPPSVFYICLPMDVPLPVLSLHLVHFYTSFDMELHDLCLFCRKDCPPPPPPYTAYRQGPFLQDLLLPWADAHGTSPA